MFIMLSRLAQARELKSYIWTIVLNQQMSRPAPGAWIEINRKENQLRTQPSKFTVAQNDYRTNRKFVDTVKKVINEIGVEGT